MLCQEILICSIACYPLLLSNCDVIVGQKVPMEKGSSISLGGAIILLALFLQTIYILTIPLPAKKIYNKQSYTKSNLENQS